MKTQQALAGTLAAFALSFMPFSPSFGQDEFTFKLYMESLANGNMDTLTLSFSEDGRDSFDCSYDSVTEIPAPDFIGDTLGHVGAFVIPCYANGFQGDPGDMVCLKNRTVEWGSSATIIVPEQALPVRMEWDSSLFQGHWALLTDWYPGDWPEICPFHDSLWPVEVWMDRSSAGQLESRWTRHDADREYYHILFPTEDFYAGYHPDSAGMFFIYHKFYVWMKEPASNVTRPELGSGNLLAFRQNPVNDIIEWRSRLGIRQWRIYDMSGRLMLQGDAGQAEIGCQDWPAGLYVFEWFSQDGSHGMEKLIKR